MALRKIVRLLAILAAAGLLALALQGPVAAFLAGPLVRLWWLVDSLPQQLVWGVLALLGLLVAFSLGRGPRRERPEPESPPSPSQTQLERLTQLIQLAETSPWARDLLGERLCRTAAGLRALREGVHLEEAWEEIQAGRWPTAPWVAVVLQPQPEGNGKERRTLKGWIARNDRRYANELARALEALERYAQGGTLEVN